MLNKQFIINLSILKKSLVPMKRINWEAIWPLFLSFLVKIFHVAFYYFSIFIEIHLSLIIITINKYKIPISYIKKILNSIF